jgi:hypothetical protein
MIDSASGGEDMEVHISEDELPAIRREGDDYVITFASIPLAVQGLRDLADKLEGQYEEEA